MLELLLYYQEIVEIQSKNRFLGTFLGETLWLVTES